MLQILSFVAENERMCIMERQEEGIRAARERGVKFGRPCYSLPDDFYKEALRWKRGKISCREAAENCGMSSSTFHKKASQMTTGDLTRHSKFVNESANKSFLIKI